METWPEVVVCVVQLLRAVLQAGEFERKQAAAEAAGGLSNGRHGAHWSGLRVAGRLRLL